MSTHGGGRLERPAASIDQGISSYLDLMRLGAALAVLLSHLLPALLGFGDIPGNDAVILFFVISGYVIAYTVERRDDRLDRYVINRLARLWSVLVPALLLAAVAALTVGDRVTVVFADPIVEPGPFLSASLRTILFLGQGWAWQTAAPFNDPVWSLNYEAWYYAIFAAFVFSPRGLRWPAAAFAALLAGPAIVALLPCWLVGVGLYRCRRWVLPAPAAYALFAAALAAYAAAYHLGLSSSSRHWLSHLTAGLSWRLHTSTALIGDLILACLFAATIVAVGSMPAVNRALTRVGGLARAAASRTLSIYLYHMPIFAILVGLGAAAGSTAGAFLIVAADLSLCLLLGGVTETKLALWRSALWRTYQALRPTPA